MHEHLAVCMYCEYDLVHASDAAVGDLVRCPECGRLQPLQDARRTRLRDVPNFWLATLGPWFVLFTVLASLLSAQVPIHPAVVFFGAATALAWSWVWMGSSVVRAADNDLDRPGVESFARCWLWINGALGITAYVCSAVMTAP